MFDDFSGIEQNNQNLKDQKLEDLQETLDFAEQDPAVDTLARIISREQSRVGVRESSGDVREAVDTKRKMKETYDPETTAKMLLEEPFIVDPETQDLLIKVLPALNEKHPYIKGIIMEGGATSGGTILRRATGNLQEGATDLDAAFFVDADNAPQDTASKMQIVRDFADLVQGELQTNDYDLPDTLRVETSANLDLTFCTSYQEGDLEEILQAKNIDKLFQYLDPVVVVDDSWQEMQQKLFADIRSSGRQEEVIDTLVDYYSKRNMKFKPKHFGFDNQTVARYMYDDQGKDTQEQKDIKALQAGAKTTFREWLTETIQSGDKPEVTDNSLSGDA